MKLAFLHEDVRELSKTEIRLLIRVAGSEAQQTGDHDTWLRWLAYAADVNVPEQSFYSVVDAFEQLERAENEDLMLWFETNNTDANRERVLDSAEDDLNWAVNSLAFTLTGTVE
jgi:hypothetical protein